MTYPLQPTALTQTYTSITPDATNFTKTIPTPGAVFRDPEANKTYKFVKNSHSSALTVGDVVTLDLTGASTTTVFRPTTATLNLMAGVAMGAIPAAGWGWIQTWGNNDSTNIEGTTDVVLGDSLKAVDAQLYAVKDQAIGTEATYARHLLAREAYTTNSAALKKVKIFCEP